MPNETTMRNPFWDRIYHHAKQDKKVMLVCADMGAPAIDKFRKDLPYQYVNVGIAEQSMMSLSAGLAKEGHKVYAYAIAPFITSRVHEFTKLNAGLMRLPITAVGVGAGFGYEDSGPTHHTTEDISIMRAIPHLNIFGPSDNSSSIAIADITYRSQNPSYVRLERQFLPDIHKESEDYTKGFSVINSGKKTCIISTGNMTHNAIEASKAFGKGKGVGIIDLYQIKPTPKGLTQQLSKYENIVSLEEHLLDGGLGSIISEIITDNNLPVRLKRLGLSDYIYAYGGRKNIQQESGIDTQSVIRTIKDIN